MQDSGTLRLNKRPADDNEDILKRRTRGVTMDYKRLDNPFSDMDDNEDSMLAIHLMINDKSYTAVMTDAPISLKQAKLSPKWLEWEKAIETKLEQLQDMGIWRLVKKPLDTIPIANKWLFVKKTNNLGQIKKYKAWLVIKGCSQHPRFDFNETYSPVVQIETVRAILAIVPQLNLQLQQMDIKGAYLNGVLKENIYMKQPERYTDGTDDICHLTKTLYGLKQVGREWNIQFNKGLQNMDFK